MWMGVLLTLLVIAAILSGGAALMIVFAAGMSDSPSASADAMVEAKLMGGIFVVAILAIIGVCYWGG